MIYREHPPPPELSGLIKCFWTLEAKGEAGGWIEHRATPDGCIELIRRLAGRSRWDGDQPDCFAVGLIEAVTPFEVGTGSRFAAVRLWPWAWPLLSDLPLAAIRGRWVAFDDPALIEPDRIVTVLAKAARLNATGRAIIASASVEEMSRASGMAPRTLQRWFARQVGMPPRRYLRLLRFQRAFEAVHDARTLADHAAASGFADQAHMARDFREMAGVPARAARRGSKGPFLS